MKNTSCPALRSTEIKNPIPIGGLFSVVEKGLWAGAADVVNKTFIIFYYPLILDIGQKLVIKPASGNELSVCPLKVFWKIDLCT